MVTINRISFRRFGRSYQAVIRSAKDLQAAVELDEALWVATASPIDGLDADPVFLELIDADGNGRIMCWEMRDAVDWMLDVLADHSGVNDRSETLALDAINGDSADGRHIRAAAQKILRLLGNGDALTLDQVRQVKSQVTSSSVSEAGVVLPNATEDVDIGRFLTDIITAVGGAPHPSDAVGVDETQLDAFLAELASYLQWRRRGQAPAGGQTNDIFPLGERTVEAYELFRALRPKLDQYFAQCHAVALDESLLGRMGWTAEELDRLDLDDTAAIDRLLSEAPIARAVPSLTLSFDVPVNPRDESALEAFRETVAKAVLGSLPVSLSARQWEQIKQFFAAHDAWAQAKPASNIAAVDAVYLEAYQDDRYARAVRELITHSRETAFHLDSIRLVEKLILYQAGLLDLANNFIAFPYLYDPADRAMFEMGTVILDGRRFTFAVKVTDRNEHLKMGATANMYLMYVQVTPRGEESPFELAVPVTAGSKGNLCIGKRGIFQDRAGLEHDARVVRVVENPISLGEAMVSPFVRLGRMLTGKIESITGKAEQKFDTQAQASINQVGETPAAQQAQSPGMSGGMLMGAGVALAALGSALAYITQKLSETSWVAIVIAIGGAILAVLLPMVLVASLKLRKRDLSAVLEGSGWAINARMRLTRKQGRVFTQHPRRRLAANRIPKLPKLPKLPGTQAS